MFGLSENEYTYILHTVVEPIEAKKGKVFCFGSRSRGDYKKFSDLDLLVSGDDSLKPLLGKISEHLEEGNFPYKVDLVHESDLAESYKESAFRDKTIFA